MLVPLYSLGVLIFLKMLVPNPNFPEVREPGRLISISPLAELPNKTVAVVADWDNANGTEVDQVELVQIERWGNIRIPSLLKLENWADVCLGNGFEIFRRLISRIAKQNLIY